MPAKKRNGLIEYLESIGALENGDITDDAKKTYRRQYQASWRNEQRKKHAQFTISLDEQEAKQIRVIAKRHKRSCTRFLKEAVFAYINQTVMTIDVLAVRTIEQLLALNYDQLRSAFDAYQLPFDVGQQLLAKMEALEARIIQEIHPTEIKISEYGDKDVDEEE